MYEVDEQDRVATLEGIPKSSVGAPLPLIIANDSPAWSRIMSPAPCQRVVLAYYLETADPSCDGQPVRVLDQEQSDEPIAIVRLDCIAHMFGPPNDEAFSGHPLASRGLHPYGAFRIEGSSWIRKLERMNRVHPYHRPEHFEQLDHFVFAFHDSTFECVCCRDFDVRIERGSVLDVTPAMLALLFEK